MRKLIKVVSKVVSIGLIASGCFSNLYAAGTEALTSSNALQILNKEINELYGVPNYYHDVSGNTLNKKLFERGIQEAIKDNVMNFHIAYGTENGRNRGGIIEYLGYTPGNTNDRDVIENREFKWDAWGGQPIQSMDLIKKPWENRSSAGLKRCEKSHFDGKNVSYTMPDGTKKTLNDAIQTGLNIRYGGKQSKEVCEETSNPTAIVYSNNAKPRNGGDWIDYVHIVQPPTYYSWGQGYMYIDSGKRYLGVSIAPFSLVQSDLWAEIESAPNMARYTYEVNVTAAIKSSFSKEQTTDFAWSVIGKKSGKAVEGIQYTGYGGLNTISGKCKIPAQGKDATFNISFKMPNEPVVVKFTVNKNTGIKELTKDNNTATYEIDLEPYEIREKTYKLDYDELTKQIEHTLAGGNHKASVTLPKGSWVSNLTGKLNVNITNKSKNDKQTLVGAKVKAGTNDPVDEAATSVTRSPIIEGTIKRTTTGDDPLNHKYLNAGLVTNHLTSAYDGSVNRTYEYHEPHTVSYTDSEGNTHSKSCSGCSAYTRTDVATGKFKSGEDRVSIKTYIYNGRESMPQVAARKFLNEVQAPKTLERTIYWESDKYPMPVQRWMANVDVDGSKDWVPVDGQYKRIFSQQNKATVTWNVESSMNQIYATDRNSAKNGSQNKKGYPHAALATDRQLQGYAYPFKSGYYFNPAGEYKFTIRTEIFKNKVEQTKEHKALVDRIIGSFRYTSAMTYVDNSGTPTNIALKINNPESADRYSDSKDTLIVAERDYKQVREDLIPYSVDSSGESHKFFKEILEGYEESNTSDSKEQYKYREYIKSGEIYRIVEETTVTIRVNPENVPVYTFRNMKNGNYKVKAWLEDIKIGDITNVPNMTVKGIKTENGLDSINVTVVGSMYDDLNNGY